MIDEYFDKKAAEWDLNPVRTKLARTVADFIRESIPLNKKPVVLDYGCGTGLLTFLLADTAGKIYAADISDGMLSEVRKKITVLNSKNIELVNFDITKDKSLNKKFDLIVSVMTMHHIPDTPEAITKLAGLLKPGGWIVIVDLCVEDGSFHKEGKTIHNGIEPQDVKKHFENSGICPADYQNIFEIEKNNRTYPLFCIYGRKT